MGSFLKRAAFFSIWWLLLLPGRLVEDRFYQWANSKLDESNHLLSIWKVLLVDWGLGIFGAVILIGILLSFLIVAIKLKGSEQEKPTTQSVGEARDVQQVEIQGDHNTVSSGPSATSYNQSGGITAGIVNVDTKPIRTLTPELKSSLLRDVPNDRPVQVMGMNGDSESMSFANEIYDVLKANNYTMLNESATWHMFFNPPISDIKINEGNGGAEWWIVVGPSK